MMEALPLVATYMESLMNDGNAPIDHSDSLYRGLTAQTYTESFLNDGSAPDSRDRYRVTSE